MQLWCLVALLAVLATAKAHGPQGAHHKHDEAGCDHGAHHHHHHHVATGRRRLQDADDGTQCGTRTLTAKELARVETDFERWQQIHGVCNATYCPIRDAETTITIQTVWHSIQTSSGGGGITAQMITDSMTVMNNAFASAGFVFNLIRTTTTNNDQYYTATGGTAELAMKSALRQGDESTLNIYSNGIDSSGLLGYATFPTDYTSEPLLDGVVIGTNTAPGGTTTPYNEGDTLVHEVGHWLFLYHVFQGGCSGSGDFVDDTPPQQTATRGCPAGQDSCTGGGVDSIENYMDYSDDSCMFKFTPGQISRMIMAWNTYRATGTPLPTGPVAPSTPAPTLATPAPTPQPTISCSTSQTEFKLDLTTDRFGTETTWVLVNECTSATILSNGPYPSDTVTTYVETYCITSGQRYTFTMFDSFGDGLCCDYGDGSYEIFYGGTSQGGGAVFDFSSTISFGACSGPTAPNAPSAPTVPPSTPAPTGPPTFCFSDQATVPVQNQGPIVMPVLAHGDKVLTANGYQTLFAFGHRDSETMTEFLQIHTEEHPHKPLEITRQHLVFVVGKPHAVPAHSIQPGDILQSSQWEKGVVVKKITTIHRKGLYAPVTTDGTVVVDGVLSSCYIALQSNAGEYVELQGGVSTGLSQHFFAHLAMTPVRMVCLGISAEICKSYDSDGLASFARMGFAVARWADTLSFQVQVLLLPWYMLLMGALYGIECLFGPRVALFVIVATTTGAAAAFAKRRPSDTKNKAD